MEELGWSRQQQASSCVFRIRGGGLQERLFLSLYLSPYQRRLAFDDTERLQCTHACEKATWLRKRRRPPSSRGRLSGSEGHDPLSLSSSPSRLSPSPPGGSLRGSAVTAIRGGGGLGHPNRASGKKSRSSASFVEQRQQKQQKRQHKERKREKHTHTRIY